jgi:adenylate kinase
LHRLATYNEKTSPLIGFYEKEGLLKTVSGTSSDVVVNELKSALGL